LQLSFLIPDLYLIANVAKHAEMDFMDFVDDRIE